MIQRLLNKYREKEEKLMYYLKSKYSTEKIEKLHKTLRYVCCFLLFVNVCTTIIQINVLANNIEEMITEEAETLTVVLSEQDSNVLDNGIVDNNAVDNNTVDNNTVDNDTVEEEDLQVKTTKTYTLDSFSKELESVGSNENLDKHQENLYITKRLIVLSDKPEFNNYGANAIISYDNLYILSYDSEELCKKAHESLINNRDIISVEIDSVMEIEENVTQNTTTETEVQTDSELKKHLDSLDVKSQVNVAILDTGIDISNNLWKDRLIDLKANLSSSGEENSITDDNGHGTDMATLIAENSNSNVKLMPIKIANKDGKATILSTYIGIKKAMENHANVINISMNTAISSSSQILTDIINEASDKGIIVVASAGNNGLDVKDFTPSNIDSAIVVSAVEQDHTFSKYSNYGGTIDYCSYGSYQNKTGTSYAAANVTGIIGDLLSKNEPVSILDNYAMDLEDKGIDDYFGNGFIGLKVNTKIQDDWTFVDEEKENIMNMPDFNTLTDEEINVYVDNSEPWQIGYYLNSLSEQDYFKIIKRNTSISGEITLYDLVEDSENKENVLTTNERKCYYYEFCQQEYSEYKQILQTSATNEYNTKTGFYTLYIAGTGKDQNTGWVQINVQFNNYTPEGKILTAATGAGANHIWLSNATGTTRGFTLLGASIQKTSASAGYSVVYIQCSITLPAYCYMSNGGMSLPNTPEDHGRLNFNVYDTTMPNGSGASSLVKEASSVDRTVNFCMQANIHQMGMSYDSDEMASIHNVITLNINRNLHTVSLGTGTGIDSVDGAGYYYYGDPVTVTAYVKNNDAQYTYGWSQWGGTYSSASQSYTFIMPDADVGLTAYGTQTINQYTQTVQHYTWNAASNNWQWFYTDQYSVEYGQVFTPTYSRTPAQGYYNYQINFDSGQATGAYVVYGYNTVQVKYYPITYYVSYNGNGATSGSTVTSTHFYDASKNLTSNGYQRAYTVTYNYNGSGQANSTATASATFNGWATSSNGAKVYNNNQSVVNLTTTHAQTIQLYANWTLKSVVLGTPTRVGYNFIGWYDAPSGGNKIGNAGQSYTPTQNKTLYAHWEPITYYVSYNGNGATSGSTATSTHFYDASKNLTSNGYQRAYTVTYNYNGSGQANSTATASATFNGWATSANGAKVYNNNQSVVNLTTKHETIQLYANWTLNSIILGTPTRVGHNFIGWYDVPTGGNKIGNAGQRYTPTGNITLYAHWEPWTLKVNVNLVDTVTKNTIRENANFKVYEYNKNTGTYDNFIMNLAQKEDKTYITSNFLVYSDTNLGRFRIIEETAPYGYYGDWENANQTAKIVHDINIEEIIRTRNYNGQNVQDKGTIQITIENKTVKAKVNVNIIDTETRAGAQADATLEGAEYGIYAKENIVYADGVRGIIYTRGSIVQRQTIQNGQLVFNDLELGQYYIKQITPPKGYTNSETQYDMILTYQGERIELVEKNTTVEEKVNKQAFQLIKVGNIGNNDEFVGLEGVGFKIYLITNLSKVKNGEIRPNANGTYNLEDFKQYDFSNEQVAIDYTNHSAGENIPEIFTDEDGYVLSPELAYGQYVICESTVPEDRVQIKPFFVTIEEDNRTPKKLRIFYDGEFTAKIQVIKQDRTTGRTVLKANAQYRIYNQDTQEYVEQWITYPVKTLIGSEENPYTTDESGTMTTPLNLDIGNYRLEEVTAPNGYVIQGKEGESEKGIYTEKASSPVEFSIYKTMATEYDEDTGDAIFKVYQQNEQQLGSVTINLTGEYLNETTKDEIENYQFGYQIRPIQGAEFEIYAKYHVMSQDNQNDIVYHKDELVRRVQTDELGNCYIDQLPIGIYYIKQSHTIDGFVLNKTIKDIEISYEGQEKAVVYRNDTYENARQKVEINIINKDRETEEVLTGAKFGLYTTNNIQYTDANGIQQTINANEKIYELDTDENGIAKWSSEQNIDLPLGEYYIQQLEAPYGYITNVNPLSIRATYKGEEKEKVEINLEFTNQQSKTMIKVQDQETKNGLAETQMKLLDKNGQEVNSWTTEESGEKLIQKLQRGETYTLQEIKPRTNYINEMLIGENNNEMTRKEGTEIEEITFVVKDILDIQNIIVGNLAKVGNIEIIKQGEVLIGAKRDEEGNIAFNYEKQNLAGAEYSIYAKEDIIHPDGHIGVIIQEGTKIAEGTTTTEGIKITSISEELKETQTEEIKQLLNRGLILGKYDIQEAKAPEGYYLNLEENTKEVDIKEENNNQEIITKETIFENQRQKIEITLTNQDTETKEELQGAKFTLYAREDINYVDTAGQNQTILANQKIYEITTNENGVAKWGTDLNLPLGKYYIKQTEAAYGYITNEQILEIDGEYIGQDINILSINLEFTNQQSKTMIKVQDQETKNGLAGVQMKLLDQKGQEIDSWTTEETGEKSIQKLQRGKTYTLQEIKPRNNYINEMIIGENNNEMARKEGTEIEEMTFVVKDVVEIQNIIVGNLAKVGNIEIIKQGEVLIGAERNEEGNIAFNYEKQNLAGAEYSIYAKEDIIHPDGHIGVIIPKGTKVAEGTTTTEGVKITSMEEELKETKLEEVKKLLDRGLALGKYDIQETKAPKGYYLNSEENTKEIDLKEESNYSEIITKEVIFENERQKIKTEDVTQDPDETGETKKSGIYKLDEETGEPIQGTEIGIFIGEDLEENGKLILDKDELIQKSITDENGYIKLNRELPLGKYYVQEIKASNGYEYKDEKIEVDFTNVDESQDHINLYVEMENQKTQINIINTDIEENPLEGTKLQLQTIDGDIIEEWESTNESYTIKGLLTEETYKIVVKEPTKGYVTPREIEFSLDKYGKIIVEEENQYDEDTIITKNEKTKTVITVIDAETEEELEEVHIKIIDKETGEIAYEFDTKEEKGTIEGLPIGEYEVIQTMQKGGYITTKTTITIDDENDIQEKVLKQEQTKLLIKIKDEEDIDIEAIKIELKDVETGEIKASTNIGNKKDNEPSQDVNEDNEPSQDINEEDESLQENANEEEETIQNIIQIEKVDDGYLVKRLEIGDYDIEVTLPKEYKAIEKQKVSIEDTEEIKEVEMRTRKLIFDIAIQKYLSSISINGREQNVNQDFNKLEINRRNINQAQILLKYVIKVSNIGEIGGNIEKIIDELPQGVTFDEKNSDSRWEKEGNDLIIKELATKEIEVGESKEYIVTLKWNSSMDNFGSIVNKARIEGVNSQLNCSENQEGNDAQAETLFSIATGEDVEIMLEIITVILVSVAVIGMLCFIEIKVLTRKK